MKIKNIIFDMGGVILNIDMKKTKDAFAQLGVLNPDLALVQNMKLIDKYNKGKLTDAEFREKLRRQLDLAISDKVFDAAWNAMLLDLPWRNLQVLADLKAKGYQLFLLSNTNSSHHAAIHQQIHQEFGLHSFGDYFTEEFYSHLTGIKKPELEAYTQILNKHHLLADETLFIDDSPECVNGAAKAGIHELRMSGKLYEFDLPAYINKLEKAEVQAPKLSSHALTA